MAEPASVDFELFTTLRYDPALILADWNQGSPLFLMKYHARRLQKAAEVFHWEKAQEITNTSDFEVKFKALCKRAVQGYKGEEQALKIRVLLSKEGDLRTEVGPLDDLPFDLMSRAYFNPDKEVPSHPGYIITAYLDTEATSSSPFTSIKTTHRPHYDAARKRAEIASFKELKEVILFNEKDEITEASTYSVAFWRDGKWVTPPLDSGCLAGTARAWMLEHGLIAEKVVPRESLQDEEWVLLSNGAKGVQLGKVSLDLVRNKT